MTNLIHDRFDEVPAQRKAVSRFTVHDNHIVCVIRLSDGYKAECDTCSLSSVIVKAILFMHGNNVRNMTIDGCPIKRI